MLVRRMAKFTDDADYDSGETFENVSSTLSDDFGLGAFYIVALTTRPNFNKVDPVFATWPYWQEDSDERI
ncbi:unnamed protein product [Protopolystoma xenopodis]|uniref:Uncharacterized protein n=1 Tax=Protopolystoma xenopodis TaxID=117903 RepID=A0A3S5ATM3_9PLAT|nr:unnamed protein product [Protopolystoma xenopodis]